MNTKRLKVLTVVGTRPEIIRLSLIIKKLDSSKSIQHILVHTGQNYDYELNEIFFADLEVRKPDYFLNAAGINAAKTIGLVISNIDDILEKKIQMLFCCWEILIVPYVQFLLKKGIFRFFTWKRATAVLIKGFQKK